MADNSKTGSIWTIKPVELDLRNLDRDFAALFTPGMFAAMVKIDKRKAKAVKQPRQKKESQFDSLMKGFKL